MNKMLSVVAAILFAGGAFLPAVGTVSASGAFLGDHRGCSALEDETTRPSVGDAFTMTIGAPALNSADTDTDGTPDSVEQCICDSLAVAGLSCDPAAPSSDYDVVCVEASTGPGNRVTLNCEFDAVDS